MKRTIATFGMAMIFVATLLIICGPRGNGKKFHPTLHSYARSVINPSVSDSISGYVDFNRCALNQLRDNDLMLIRLHAGIENITEEDRLSCFNTILALRRWNNALRSKVLESREKEQNDRTTFEHGMTEEISRLRLAIRKLQAPGNDQVNAFAISPPSGNAK
jgi:hypothetical protein